MKCAMQMSNFFLNVVLLFVMLEHLFKCLATVVSRSCAMSLK